MHTLVPRHAGWRRWKGRQGAKVEAKAWAGRRRHVAWRAGREWSWVAWEVVRYTVAGW